MNDSFEDIKEVIYTNSRYKYIVKAGLDEVDARLEKKIIYRNFFMKSCNWKYEGEYRIVRKQEDQYLKFNSTSISAGMDRVPLRKKYKNAMIL